MGGARRFPGGGITVGGGGLGLAGLVIYLLLNALTGGGGLSGPLGNLDNETVASAPPSEALGNACQTGAEANAREDCRRSATSTASSATGHRSSNATAVRQ